MKNLHVVRRATPTLRAKIGWSETLPMRVKLFGWNYPRHFFQIALLYFKFMGGLTGLLVLLNWASGSEAWFGPHGMIALGLAAAGSVLIGVLIELFSRRGEVKDGIFFLGGAPEQWWPTAQIVAVRREDLSEHVARIQVKLDGEMKPVTFAVRTEMAGRLVEALWEERT